MSELIDGIGLISGVLGIASFFQSEFPAQPEASGAAVRVGTGIGSNPTDEALIPGTIHAIYGYDGNNEYLGVSDIDIAIPRDAAQDITIHQYDRETSQARFINLEVGADGACVTYLTVTQPDGLQRSWYGDIGQHCGQAAAFYPTGAVLGKDHNGNDFRPYCVWLDADGNDGLGGLEGGAKAAQLKVDIFMYYTNASSIDPNTDYCAGTVWSANGTPTMADPLPRSLPPMKRRSLGQDKMLVVSSVDTDIKHSAEALCAHERSRGPDFINLSEQKYCDMLTKTVYPLCNATTTTECFDLDAKKVEARAAHGPSLLPRAVNNARSFTHVEYW